MALTGECVGTGAPLPYPDAEPEVIHSAGGYFIGFLDDDGGVYSRESRYYANLEQASEALADNSYSRVIKRRGIIRHTVPGFSLPDIENTPNVRAAAKKRKSGPRKPSRRNIGFGSGKMVVTLDQQERMRTQWVMVSHQEGVWTPSELRLIDEWRQDGVVWRDIATITDRCLLSAPRPSQMGQAVSSAHRKWAKTTRPSKYDPNMLGSAEVWKARHAAE